MRQRSNDSSGPDVGFLVKVEECGSMQDMWRGGISCRTGSFTAGNFGAGRGDGADAGGGDVCVGDHL